MRAVVYDRYGPPDVMRLADVPRPVPNVDEILIKVHAVAVTRADCATREANRHSGGAVSVLSRIISGFRGPRQPILGSEVAGEVAAVGSAVEEFTVGDHVFGSTGFHFGAYAEFVCVPASGRITQMASGMSFEDAASITDGGLNSLWCLRLAKVRPGHRVLVYGASGAIGTAGVQLAKHFGADVTAVCTTKNFGLVTSLGADRVIDYTQEDYEKRRNLRRDLRRRRQAVVRPMQSLAQQRRQLPGDGRIGKSVLTLWTSLFGAKKVIFKIPPRFKKEDVVYLKGLIDVGEYRAVIDRRYPLEDVVEAATYVETEQKVGNVVLTIG